MTRIINDNDNRSYDFERIDRSVQFMYPSNPTNSIDTLAQSRLNVVNHLLDRETVLSSSKDGIRALKRFRSGSSANQILTVLVSLRFHQVLEKLFDICVERFHLLPRHEREHRHAPIRALVQIKSDTTNRYRAYGSRLPIGPIGGRNRSGTTEGREPDHNFEFLGSGRRGGREDVVGHVGDESRTGV